MKLNEIEPGMMGIRVSGKVVFLGDVREVKTKFGTEIKVANAKIADDSGEVEISLWGDQIDKVKEGMEIELDGAMAKEWNGKIQVSVGKRGSITVK